MKVMSSALRERNVVSVFPSPLAGESRGEGGWHDRPPSLPGRAVYPRAYFIVGMTNSAPLRMPVGQRVVTVLRWV